MPRYGKLRSRKPKLYRRKRMSRPKNKPSKSFVKKVQKIIHKDVETKKQVYLSSATAFNQQIQTQADCLRIMPSIPQGSANSNRIANEITIQEMRIRGCLTFALNQTAIALTRIGVRMMIVRAKRFNDWIAAATDFATSNGRLLETQGSFDGSVQCFNAPVNEDYYSVIVDKKFYFSQSQTAGGPTTEVWNSTKLFDFKLPYHRNRKLIYDDNYLSGDATNYPYFILIGYVKLDGTAADASTVSNLTLQYTSTVKYEDA